MKRSVFVELFVAHVQRARKVNFPDLRPSENAASAWGDRKAALNVWRRMSKAARQNLTREFFEGRPDAK